MLVGFLLLGHRRNFTSRYADRVTTTIETERPPELSTQSSCKHPKAREAHSGWPGRVRGLSASGIPRFVHTTALPQVWCVKRHRLADPTALLERSQNALSWNPQVQLQCKHSMCSPPLAAMPIVLEHIRITQRETSNVLLCL